jgi:hypothetical protein
MPYHTNMIPPNRPPYPSFSLVVYCAFLPPPELFTSPASTTEIQDVSMVVLPVNDEEDELMVSHAISYCMCRIPNS